jgi:hypothetical protein
VQAQRHINHNFVNTGQEIALALISSTFFKLICDETTIVSSLFFAAKFTLCAILPIFWTITLTGYVHECLTSHIKLKHSKQKQHKQHNPRIITMKKGTLTIALIASIASAISAQNIPNPLLPNVADIGVLNYNGKYYLGGCRTDGDFYITTDLINWSQPIHVIDMKNNWTAGTGAGNNQIHSNDMIYYNGTVHAYWSVNYWGRDKHIVHVAHSEATNPMGPYDEPVKDRWMDNRIDPKVFRDDDGSLYMYMVRFTDGNAIWARKMKNYREFDKDFYFQFASIPDTWERMDNVVAEGPWVIKYHNQYYMMYNANHTAGEWGNYMLGVAQADTPVGFNNANKYSHPVVMSNQTAVDDNYVNVLKYQGTAYNSKFAYTTADALPDNWYSPEFNDSDWAYGTPGFAAQHINGSHTYRQGTPWNTSHIRLRKHFQIADTKHNYALRVTHNGATTVFINGKEIYRNPDNNYTIINLTTQQKKTLTTGDNLIAVATDAPQHRSNGYINVELFDLGSETAEPEIVWTPGQPNILHGPNGFEWWLIYMANNDAGTRSQYVDRVHFFGDKLTVDGITSAKNGGFHPTPALPTYGDCFDNANQMCNWAHTNDDAWSVTTTPSDNSSNANIITDGELTFNGAQPATLLLRDEFAAQSYLWEVNIKPTGDAGIIAAADNNGNTVSIGFKQTNNTAIVAEQSNGSTKHTTLVLPDDFKWDVYHKLRVERDGTDLTVWIDEMQHPGIIETSLASDAIPGIYATHAGTAFDGVIFTIGFDDGNNRMNNWAIKSGELTATKRGAKANGSLCAIKGKPSADYEFTTQISNIGNDANSGIYPLYIDDDNYISALIAADNKTLNITSVRKGKIIANKQIPLERLATLYSDIKFTDSYDKGYLFDYPTIIDEIQLPRYEKNNPEDVHDNMFAFMTVESLQPDGSWKSISTDAAAIADNPTYNTLKFAPERVEQLRFINKNAGDGAYHIYKIRVNQLLNDSYNLRAVRLGDTLHLFLDGKDVAELNVTSYGPSVIGLRSISGSPEYHGTLYYHRNDAKK